MIIQAVKFRKDGFYSQPFAMGGEEGAASFDPNVRYRGSLQNYLIRTEDDLILEEQGVRVGLTFNPGNHFMKPELRCACAFARLLNAGAE